MILNMPRQRQNSSGQWLDPFFLPVLVFILFVFMAFSLSGIEKSEKGLEQVLAEETVIVLDKGLAPPDLSAQGVFAQDTETGRVLFAKNQDAPFLPASTTKIATSLVALSYYQLEDVVDVKVGKIDGQIMGLKNGEKISARNLLYGLLVFSANDAGEVLAANYPGGRENFIAAMNQLAKNIGLENTNFKNPTGFDQYLHFSSARDLANLSVYAMRNPVFADIVRTREIEVAGNDGKITHKLTNINKLLGEVEGVIGVKTGWTLNAGEALVTLIERGETRIVVSMLGSQDRFGETKKLIDWIYSNYEWSRTN